MKFTTASFLSCLVLTVGITASAYAPLIQWYAERSAEKQDQIERIREDSSLRVLVNALGVR